MLGEGHRSTIDDCLSMVARNVAPDVQFDDDALVPFLKQHTLSKTPSERAQVVDDWTRMIVATQQGCSSALMNVPYEMKTYPRNSIAKSLRYEADGRIVVEVHFNMFLGVDREEVQALKVEIRDNKQEMKLNKEEAERQRCADKQEADRKQRESSAELREMRDTVTVLQKKMENIEAKHALVKQKKAIQQKHLRERQKGPVESAPSNEDAEVENQKTDTASTTTVATTFSCNVDACNGISFESKPALHNHNRKHKDPEYACTHSGCAITFKRHGNMKRHILICKFDTV
jgi:hypothetical protein